VQLYVPKSTVENVLWNWPRPLACEIQLATEIWVTDPMKRVKYRKVMLTETDEDENLK
jgi:hypothetical protein